ncbi:hypothetical protein Bca4012_006656 [Brassica carinata]|uniref:Uncharacterized protein n=1 Tax=Brassica carinata TaxID=52824 RepID=A0A8X7RQF7_BRACI|nr:hypothetical protein Bca52824_039135 [Brassica carinata]
MKESADGENAASTESRQRCSTCGGLKKGNGASWMLGSRGTLTLFVTGEKLKVTLKQYRGISASELVTRSLYEELSSASVSYISKLSTYRSLIKERIKDMSSLSHITV